MKNRITITKTDTVTNEILDQKTEIFLSKYNANTRMFEISEKYIDDNKRGRTVTNATLDTIPE